MRFLSWSCVSSEARFSRLKILLIAVLLGLAPAHGHAKVEKVIDVSSIPPGADVFLKVGNKETFVGQTPLRFRHEFFSEKSVVRLIIRKPGYADLVQKVQASQGKVVVSLVRPPVVRDPGTLKGARLKSLQREVNPLIEPVISKFLFDESGNGVSADRPATVKKLKEGAYGLELAMTLTGAPAYPKGRNEAVWRDWTSAVWDRFSEKLAVPLARRLQGGEGISVLSFAVFVADANAPAQAKIVSNVVTEQVCVPGQRAVVQYNPCATTVPTTETTYDSSGIPSTRVTGTKCVGGNTTTYVYDRCLHKRSRQKIDTTVVPGTAGAPRIVYALSLDYAAGKLTGRQLYEKLSVTVFSASGEIRYSTLLK